mmetsp:Transcript_99866/g.168547  ORF Transcript_99866/g.168547 Transcript_99866/m.168547 type:complete len:98 (-) Transcript_99866:52-345(-)
MIDIFHHASELEKRGLMCMGLLYLVLRTSDRKGWVHGLSECGCEIIGEADCSGQFYSIKPQDVMQDLSTTTARWRWTASEKLLASAFLLFFFWKHKC